MAVALSLRPVECGDHSVHERQLSAVWLVRELHRNSADVDRVRGAAAAGFGGGFEIIRVRRRRSGILHFRIRAVEVFVCVILGGGRKCAGYTDRRAAREFRWREMSFFYRNKMK